MGTAANGGRNTRIAVVGAGYWGKNLVRNFHDLNSLAGVFDADETVRSKYQREYTGTRMYDNFDRVLSDPSITGIALATPAITHYELAFRALSAGKDVMVEKPLALRVDQGAELVRVAEANHRVLMVGHILRYHPAVQMLEKLISDGRLGKIDYIYSNRLNIGKIRTEENILWSFAPHDISVILALLNEMPQYISCQGGTYLNQDVPDITLSSFQFPSGVRGHIFVSWLNPTKEQRLVVVGSEKMAVFDDAAEKKLIIYSHRVEWRNRIPTAVKGDGEIIELENREPLRAECQHFVDSILTRKSPISDGQEGLRVLRVLDACQRAITNGQVELESDRVSLGKERSYYVHESAYVDEGADVGADTKIWHFAHVMNGAKIGRHCTIGQNVNVDGGAVIGNNVKIQNNVSVYAGCVVEDDVFLGPSCVLTNVSNPRSQVNRHSLYETTYLRRGCTIGANATVVCGTTIGRYAFVGAGAVVTKNVPDFALVIGNPARQVGWMSRHGHRLQLRDSDGIMRCPESGFRYSETKGVLRCLDLDEEAPLPADLAAGRKSYKQFKEESSYEYSATRS